MKIKDRELLEQVYSNVLAVLRDSNSTPEQALAAYKSNGERTREIDQQIDWISERQFSRNVVKVAFIERLKALLAAAKTFDETFAVLKVLPHKNKFRDQASRKALGLANCQQALVLYRRIHSGRISKQSLAKVFRLAKTKDELWQVAVYSKTSGNPRIWKQAVKMLAAKLK